jgi:hypothetical protein
MPMKAPPGQSHKQNARKMHRYRLIEYFLTNFQQSINILKIIYFNVITEELT